MDAGIVAALTARPDAPLAALEVDELHVPHVSDAVNPEVVVLLNLSRDQLDRVGEINMIERALRAGLQRHPDAVVVANCDDVLVTSVAYDCKNVCGSPPAGGGQRLGELPAHRRTDRVGTGRTGAVPGPTSRAPRGGGGSTTTICTARTGS